MLKAVKPIIECRLVASFASFCRAHAHLRRFWQGMLLGWRAACRYKKLSIMSHEELASQGLCRASIGWHAFFCNRPVGRG